MPSRSNGKLTHCGCCHYCGSLLENPEPGKEYCPICHKYRRYRSHGFSLRSCDSPYKLQALCPVHTEIEGKEWAHRNVSTETT